MSQSTNQRIRNRKFFEAAQQGKTSDFTDITSEDVLFDATDPAGNTVLHVASMSGQEAVAKMLCRKRPSLMVTKNRAGNTPLHYALKTERYINIPALRRERPPPRDDSLFMEFMEFLKEMVHDDPEHGATMRLDANEAGESPLFLAADLGLLKSVKRLIECRMELDFKGPGGWTALHTVFWRNIEIAEELLKWKPELNNKGDDSGNTPLHYAVANDDDSKMMELLLDFDDAAPDDVQSIAYHGNDDGHTPLHVAAACGYKSMVKAIVHRHPGCVTLTDKKGRTVLHLAVQLDRVVVVKHILEHPEFAGLINDRDCDGNTPLHLTALLDNRSMFLMLSTTNRHKMDPSPVNKAGRTPRDILDLGDLKSTLAGFLGIYNPLRSLLYQAGGHHGPRLCDLSKKLNSERLATTTMKPKANGSNGQSEADNDDGSKEGKASMLEKFASNLLLVATLIITVTFAAIITMPGGFENDQNNTTTNNGYGGTALLARRRAFQAFVLTDMLAFLLAFTAALRLMWTALMMGVESPVDDIRFAQRMVHTALVAMTLAFGTGAYSVLARHCNWIAEVVLCVVCFFTLIPLMVLLASLLGKKSQEALGHAYQAGL